MNKLGILCLLTGGCIALGAAMASLPSTLPNASVVTWGAAIALALVGWRTLRHRSIVGALLVYGLLGFGIAAALLYHPTPATLGNVAEIAGYTAGYHYLAVFVLAAASVWAACLVVPTSRVTFSLALPRLHLSLRVLALAAVPLFLTIYGVGVGPLLHANAYLEHTGSPSALRVAKALTPLGILICGIIVFSHRHSRSQRATALVLSLGYETVSLATATRVFALWFPIMFAGGLLGGTWSSRQRLVAMVVTLVATVFALQVPLGLRGLPEHGLEPTVGYLIHQPATVFGGDGQLLGNVLFGAPLTLYVGQHVSPIPTGDLLTALNPLPSAFTNWYAIEPNHQLNKYTPYGAVGELLNYGWWVLVIVFACVGWGFTLAERLAARTSGILGIVGRLGTIALSALFVISCTEYTLRSDARLVYYALFLTIAIAFANVSLHRRNVSAFSSASSI